MAKPLTLTGFLNNWRKWYMEVRLSFAILGALVQTFPALRSAQSSAESYLKDYQRMRGHLFGADAGDRLPAKVYSLNHLKKGSEIFAIGCLNILHSNNLVHVPQIHSSKGIPGFLMGQALHNNYKTEPPRHGRQVRLRKYAY